MLVPRIMFTATRALVGDCHVCAPLTTQSRPKTENKTTGRKLTVQGHLMNTDAGNVKAAIIPTEIMQ